MENQIVWETFYYLKRGSVIADNLLCPKQGDFCKNLNHPACWKGKKKNMSAFVVILFRNSLWQNIFIPIDRDPRHYSHLTSQLQDSMTSADVIVYCNDDVTCL